MRKTTSRKLSSSNVDEYMANMSKIGEEIVAAGQSIATVLSRSIPISFSKKIQVKSLQNVKMFKNQREQQKPFWEKFTSC